MSTEGVDIPITRTKNSRFQQKKAFWQNLLFFRHKVPSLADVSFFILAIGMHPHLLYSVLVAGGKPIGIFLICQPDLVHLCSKMNSLYCFETRQIIYTYPEFYCVMEKLQRSLMMSVTCWITNGVIRKFTSVSFKLWY